MLNDQYQDVKFSSIAIFDFFFLTSIQPIRQELFIPADLFAINHFVDNAQYRQMHRNQANNKSHLLRGPHAGLDR
jgi:hypothetical protein